MHKYYAQENGKIYYAITSRDARENDATQTSEVSKYQIISIQPKLDKFQLKCYSKCSKWWPKVNLIIVAKSWNPCLHESVVYLVEATHIAVTKAVWIAMFQLFHYWIGRKLNFILKLEVATLKEQISHLLHIVLLQSLSGTFLPNII